MDPSLIALNPDVANAIADHTPIIALESTLVAHGLPWPENLETAELCDRVVRDNGAIPATIAIIDGCVRVGLNDNELGDLARSGRFVKASRRELPSVVARRACAATTISATLAIARQVGIFAMATGGL